MIKFYLIFGNKEKRIKLVTTILILYQALEDALKQVDEGSGGFGMANMEDELRVLEERLDAEDDDELFCIACNKEMRNEKAFAAHRKQKKHLENVSALRETLLKEEMINSDELKSDSDSTEDLIGEDVSINLEATVPEENKTLEPDAKPKDVPPKRKQKTKKSKGSSKKSSKNTEGLNNDLGCVVCKQEFQSKNKLFTHLKDSGHAVALS